MLAFFVCLKQMKGIIIMNGTRDFSWEVVRALGNFSEERTNYTKELNVVAWNGRPPVFDLRGWRVDKDGVKHPLKGISMTKADLIALRNLLQSIDVDSLGV